MHSVQRVGERHPIEYRPRVEVLTQDYAHRSEAGDRPDLGIMVGEHVLPDAPQGLEHHGAGEHQDWEGEHEVLDLPPYCLCIRPGLELTQARAPEFGEDLRREGRSSRVADAPAALQRLTLEYQRQAEERLVALTSNGKTYYKVVEELTEGDMGARMAADRLREAWLKERRDGWIDYGGGSRGEGRL
jgi:hypothetical protein